MAYILGVIPARYASSRFPGKPLVDIEGKPMIQRVYERAIQATKLAEVVVATDDARIAEVVKGFGGKVEMTADTHPSGTDRIAEIVPRYPAATHFINIQGDEPLIYPQQLDQLAELLLKPGVQLGTLAKQVSDYALLSRGQTVKVVRGMNGQALYFSRSLIPFLRDVENKESWPERFPFFKHIGIYGYSREALIAYPKLEKTALEQAESLEQLRWLAHGYSMQVGLTEYESPSIDTPEDLKRLLERPINLD